MSAVLTDPDATVVNLPPVRVEPPDEPLPEASQPPAGRRPRTWPALLVVAAVAGSAYLVGGVVPQLRVGTQVVFWLVGPGALVAGSLRLPEQVRLALVIPVGLAVLVGGGTVLAWSYRLTSGVAVGVAVAVVGVTIAGAVSQLAYGIVAHRRAPHPRPAALPATDAGVAVRRAALPFGFALGTVIAWALALPRLRTAESTTFGLLAASPVWFWIALVGMITTLVLAVRMPRGVVGSVPGDRAVRAARTAALWAAVMVAIIVLRLTPSLAADVPIYNWTYKHLGVVDQLLTGIARFEGSTDIYLQWPGMFAGAGWLTVQSGVAPIVLAQWITPVITLAAALLAAGLVVSSRAVREIPGRPDDAADTVGPDTVASDTVGKAAVAGWLVVVATWVGQDYFAPQAVAFVVAGAILVLLPLTRRRRSAGWLVAVLFLPLLATHQLTPYWILAVVCALVVLRRAPVWLASVLIIAAVGYLLPRLDVVASYGLFTGFSPAENVTVGPTTPTSTGQQLTSAAARICAVIIWASAAFAWLGLYRRAVNHWRGTGRGRLRSMITGLGSHGALLAMMLTGFGFVLGQSYGGEVILRVYLYSIIPAAVLIAGPLTRRLQASWVGAVTWLLVITTAAGQAYYGAWFVNKMAPADVAIGGELLSQVQPPAFTVQVMPNWPVRSTADAVAFKDRLWNYDGWVAGPVLAGSDFNDEADFKALEADVTSGAYVPVYLLVSEAMYAWSDYYQIYPPGAMQRLTSELLVRPTWRLVASDGQTMVFQYVAPGWPVGWDSAGEPIPSR